MQAHSSNHNSDSKVTRIFVARPFGLSSLLLYEYIYLLLALLGLSSSLRVYIFVARPFGDFHFIRIFCCSPLLANSFPKGDVTSVQKHGWVQEQY